MPNFDELVEHRVAISSHATVETAMETMKEKEREFIGVVEGQRFIGAVSRLHVATLLGGRFGFAVFAKKRIAEHLLPRFQSLREGMDFRQVLEKAMHREHDEFHHDVALVDAQEHYIGMIPLKALVHVQAALVEQQVRALQEQQKTLQERNVAIFRSAHRLRQSEGRFGILFENSALGVALLTLQGIIELANERLASLLGNLAVGTNIFTLLKPGDRGSFAQMLAELEQGASAGAAAEFELAVPGRGWRRMKFHTHFIAETGQVCALIDDITEQRAMEQRLAVREKSAMLESLVGGIAHELNNKLMPVLGYSELLLQPESEAPAHAAASIINQSAMEAAEIVRQLLQLSRPAATKLVPQDLRTLVEEALPVLRFRIKQENCTINLVAPEQPVPVLADPAQFKQVIVNLAFNALDAMADLPNSTLQLVIDTEGDDAHLWVIDQGRGIAPENRNRVFDPFFTTKAPSQGTGLGLSVCQSIVRQHQGEVLLEKTGSDGTTFRLTLPLQAGVRTSTQADVEAVAPRLATAVPPPPTRLRALVADDEEYITCVIQEVLRDALQAEVCPVPTAEQAIQKLKQEPFDLIISDVRMPGLGGFGLHEWLRAHQAEMVERLLFITGDAGSADLNSKLEELGVDVLRKPFRLQDLTELCRKLLAARTGGALTAANSANVA